VFFFEVRRRDFMKKKNGLILDVDEKPSMGKWIVLSLQHVFAMFGATILVPILVNNAAGEEVLSIPVTLVASGIGTLLYQLCTKSKSPVYLGSSFAFITPMILAFAKGGKGGVFTGIMAVGLAYILIALIIKIVGTKWLEKLLPPIIIGPMIMIIGLGLAPTAISSIGIEAGAKFVWQNVLVALITFLTTAFVATRAKGFFKVIPFLIGIVAGYVSSCVLGLVDFTPIKEASFFSIPAFQFPFVNYDLDFSSLVIMVPIVLVTISEHIGDHTVLGTIIGKDLIKDPGLARTLLGDGLATFVAGFIGGPSNTTYGENTSVVGMSKIASIWVLRLAAIFAIILAFLGKFTALASTIPNPVLGGVSLLLYGFISVNGLKVLVENQVDFSKNKNVIVSAAMLVIGLGGATISISSGDFSLSISGMVLAAIVGIVLNLVLKEDN
jgi:uracil permease